MDFRTVTGRLIRALATEDISYALIGGFAVGLWGVARGTVDMDFLVLRDDLQRLDRIMQQLGFTLVHRSENVSQFNGPAGGVDFLHAFRSHAVAMLARAAEQPILAGEATVRILLPADLIGMKVQAMANDPARGALDRFDIEELMRLHGTTLDWPLVAEYFALFDMQALFAELKERNRAPER